MDDEMEPVDGWLAGRLKAAVHDAHAVPRRRLLLPAPPPGAGGAGPWVRRHRAVLALVALNAATGAAAYALGVSVAHRSEGTPSAAARPSPPRAAARVAGAATVPLTRSADPLSPAPAAAALGSLWMADPRSGTVLRVDERSLRVTATITVSPNSGATTGTEGPRDVASDGSTVWAADTSTGAVVRLDPATNRVADRIPVAPNPIALAVDGGTVWVVSSAGRSRPGTLLQVDVAERRVVRSAPTGPGPSRVIATPAGVWIVNAGDGTVSRLDPATGTVHSTRPNPADYDYGYVDVAADAGGAWAVDLNRAVVEHIDPVTLDTGSAIGAGDPRDGPNAGRGPFSLALDQDSAWALTQSQLLHIDLRRGSTTSLDLPHGWQVLVDAGDVFVLTGDQSGSAIVRLVPSG